MQLSLGLLYLADMFINKLKIVFLQSGFKYQKKFTTPFVEIFLQELNKCLQKFVIKIIVYTKKLLNSDWRRKECSSSVTRVQNV